MIKPFWFHQKKIYLMITNQQTGRQKMVVCIVIKKMNLTKHHLYGNGCHRIDNKSARNLGHYVSTL
jgi:hypothetical protein